MSAKKEHGMACPRLLTPSSFCGICAHNDAIDPPWSEREAVVAYLLESADLHHILIRYALKVARGDHLQAAREGRLDGYRERARELCAKGAGNGNG